jgi:hypothetical protein
MNVSKLSAIALLLAVIGACDSGQDPGTLPQCQAVVTMSVSSGATPTISWAPRCRVSTVVVDPNSDFFDSWVLRTAADTNGLQPPIRYGASPNGSVTTIPPAVLQVGTQYRARVLRATGDSTFPFEAIGAAFFTP